jgi:hypothetical protein
VSTRAYEAIVLDLDGTLVSDDGHVRPRVRERLRLAMDAGVTVMVATGRSELACRDVVRELGVAVPAIVYNGAGLWCPKSGDLLEERLLSNRAVERTYAAVRDLGLCAVVMSKGAKVAEPPSSPHFHAAVATMQGLEYRPFSAFPTEYVIRITLMSDRHTDSAAFERDIERALGVPVYLTHFPLDALAPHRGSPLQVVDVQPPCRGKGEALRWLEESLGIPAARVVAVGDAGNDVPMFERAGLAVCMANALEPARRAAHRVIGSCNTDAIADLVDELFLAHAPTAVRR